MNKIITIQNIQEQMKKGGCWLLNDASDVMKNYSKNNNLDVCHCRTPQKFIKQDEEIIILSISKEMWAGIKKYNNEDVTFREKEGSIIVLIERGSGKSLVSVINDYSDEEFIQNMINSGYISRYEYEYYSNIENQINLPLIKTIAI